MKNISYYNLVLLIIICSSFFSCTILQWRMSDTEIQQKFSDLKIANKISYLRLDSIDLKVRVHSVKGNQNNLNLIFLHGSPSSLSAWDSYMIDSSLRERTNLYAIDRPGYGYSNFGNEMPSINLQAEIINSIIDKEKLSNVLVIGSSYGGPLAARVGYLNSNVKAVVMISPAIDPELEKDVWGSRLTQWKITRWLVPTAYRVAGDEKKVHAKELALIENDWKKMNIPILHIHGDTDDLVPYGNINFSENNFQNVDIIAIPNKGHEIAWKHPELIIPHVLKLMDEL